MITKNKTRVRTRAVNADPACDPARVDASAVFRARAANPRHGKDLLRQEMIIAGAAFVREARTQADMTQEKLAEALGISQTRVAQLESVNGKQSRPPELMTLARIARACGRQLKLKIV